MAYFELNRVSKSETHADRVAESIVMGYSRVYRIKERGNKERDPSLMRFCKRGVQIIFQN